MADDGSECICTINRKDRAHPIEVTEYFSECKRNTQPWTVSPKRMLRNKAFIQCARLAFGFAGIYDPDEAERIQALNAVETTDVPKPQLADIVSRKAAEIVTVDAVQAEEQSEELPL
jgi:hypothetical protein